MAPPKLLRELHNRNVTGSPREIAWELARSAQAELRQFADKPFPTASPLFVNLSHAFFFVFSPILMRVPLPCADGFWVEYTRIGQTFRMATLLALSRARFTDDAGQLDEDEYKAYEAHCNKTIGDTNVVLGTIQVVAALLVGATHLTSMGRPSPLHASEESLEDFGSATCHTLVVLTMVVNIACEATALSLILLSILYRFALGFVLSSTNAKMLFLAQYDPVGSVMYALLVMLTLFSMIPAIGGVLASPTWGFAGLGVPALYTVAFTTCTRVMTYELDDVHRESRQVLGSGHAFSVVKAS